MKRIESADNAWFKALRAQVHDTAAARRAGQAWLEGIHLATAALDAGLQALALVVTEEALELAEVTRLAARVGDARLVLLAPALLRQLSEVQHGRGVGLLVRRPERAAPRAGTAVVLDRVQDAGNVGTVLRTAAAAGAAVVYCLRGSAGAWSPKVLRSGMGAHFAIDIVEDVTWEHIEPALPRPLLATAAQAQAQLYQLDLRGPVTWVLGNEGAGVDTRILERCDLRVSIPQRGPVESLNVAAAAAVCLYEGLRQQLAAGA